MPPPVLIEHVKHRVFLEAFRQFLRADRAEDSLLFLVDKRNHETLYQQYLRPGAPHAVSLPEALSARLAALASQKKWTGMSAGLKEARKHVAAAVNDGALRRFLASPAGQGPAFLLATGVDGPKTKTMEALLKVYRNGRTPQDKQEAYQAMLKLTNKALLNPALRALGLEPPPPVIRPVRDPGKAVRLLGVKGPRAAELSSLITDYARATSRTQRAALINQMETLAQGAGQDQTVIAALKTSGLYRED
jgi:hypothetical protein